MGSGRQNATCRRRALLGSEQHPAIERVDLVWLDRQPPFAVGAEETPSREAMGEAEGGRTLGYFWRIKIGRRACAGDTLAKSPRMWRRDFMGARDPAEAVEVLDLILTFFGDGEGWVKGRLGDRRGNRCLVGALDFVSSHHGTNGDAAERYLADEISAAGDCNGAGEECARFRASLRRALSGERYRVSETVRRRDSLSDFNDGCEHFAKLRTLILRARAAAMNDADAEPVPGRGFDIELDELVMA